MKTRPYILIWVICFAVAMGYLEAAVVVYLRQIYYPGGFRFPLAPIPPAWLYTEMGRELATLVMLVAVGILGGRSRVQRLAFFLMAFGLWDLFYYFFLKVLIGWPPTPGTWDLLFLLPVLWVGPVWAPCVLSVTMIVLAVLLLRTENGPANRRLPPGVLRAWILGSLLVMTAFWIGPWSQYGAVAPAAYVPSRFPWMLFVAGEGAIVLGMFRLGRTYRQKHPW